MNPAVIAVIQALDVGGMLQHLSRDALMTLVRVLEVLHDQVIDHINNHPNSTQPSPDGTRLIP